MMRRFWLVLPIVALLVLTNISPARAAEVGDPVPDSWFTGQYLDWATSYRYTPLWPSCAGLPCVPVGDDNTAVVISAGDTLDIVGYATLTYQNIGTEYWVNDLGTTAVTNSALYEACSVYYSGAWYYCGEFTGLVYQSSITQNGSTADWVYDLSGDIPSGATIIEITMASVLQDPAPITANPFSFVMGKRFYIDRGDFYTSSYGVGFPSSIHKYVALRHMDASGYYGVIVQPNDYTAGDDLVGSGRPSISSWWESLIPQSIIDANIMAFIPSVFGNAFSFLQFDFSALNNIMTPVYIGTTIISTINPVVDLSLFASLMLVMVALYTFAWLYSIWRVVKGFVL